MSKYLWFSRLLVGSAIVGGSIFHGVAAARIASYDEDGTPPPAATTAFEADCSGRHFRLAVIRAGKTSSRAELKVGGATMRLPAELEAAALSYAPRRVDWMCTELGATLIINRLSFPKKGDARFTMTTTIVDARRLSLETYNRVSPVSDAEWFLPVD